MVDINRDANGRGIYLARCSPTLRGIVVFNSVYQISWKKMKKVTFCKLKMSLSRNFVYNLQTFQGFCQVHFYNFVANLE